jgi:hypothetical protein
MSLAYPATIVLPPFIYLHHFNLQRSDKEQNKTTQFAFNHRVLSAYEESHARNSQTANEQQRDNKCRRVVANKHQTDNKWQVPS